MDSAAAAIERDIAFGIEEAVELPLVQARTALSVDDGKIHLDSSDIELCKMAADGSLAAFEVIYQRYHRRTFSLTLRMTGSQTEAEDLTQEVFIQLFRKIGSFRGDRRSGMTVIPRIAESSAFSPRGRQSMFGSR